MTTLHFLLNIPTTDLDFLATLPNWRHFGHRFLKIEDQLAYIHKDGESKALRLFIIFTQGRREAVKLRDSPAL